MASRGVSAKEVVDAKKVRMAEAEALALARGAARVYATKGRKRVELSSKLATDEDLIAAIVGPSGNLRAPAILRGKTLVVGFQEELYDEVLRP